LEFAVEKALAVSDITADEPPPASIAAADGLIGESKPMQQLAELIAKAAPKPTTVLIRGESGTGKELVARAIVEQSREVWLAADHSKFNRPAMVELARLDDIDVLFTDLPPPAPFDELMAQGDVECVLCGTDPELH
jgi:hypothetical protein